MQITDQIKKQNNIKIVKKLKGANATQWMDNKPVNK
jgi:hypothetical protein